MPQDDEFVNYTTGQANPTPFVPGSQYVPPAPEKSGPSDEEYMKGQMKANVKRMMPKPPSYAAAREARKK